jgi:hypothetical protein
VQRDLYSIRGLCTPLIGRGALGGPACADRLRRPPGTSVLAPGGRAVVFALAVSVFVGDGVLSAGGGSGFSFGDLLTDRAGTHVRPLGHPRRCRKCPSPRGVMTSRAACVGGASVWGWHGGRAPPAGRDRSPSPQARMVSCDFVDLLTCQTVREIDEAAHPGFQAPTNAARRRVQPDQQLPQFGRSRPGYATSRTG